MGEQLEVFSYTCEEFVTSSPAPADRPAQEEGHYEGVLAVRGGRLGEMRQPAGLTWAEVARRWAYPSSSSRP